MSEQTRQCPLCKVFHPHGGMTFPVLSPEQLDIIEAVVDGRVTDLQIRDTDPAPTIGGKGIRRFMFYVHDSSCPTCGGSGYYLDYAGEDYNLVEHDCPTCHGKGEA